MSGLVVDDSSPWMTYVVRRGDDGPVKIGRTRDLGRRLIEIRHGSAEPIAVLHEIDGDHEKRLHTACADYRLAGEWFYSTDSFFAALANAMEGIGG